jgi:hypothetical protein
MRVSLLTGLCARRNGINDGAVRWDRVYAVVPCQH